MYQLKCSKDFAVFSLYAFCTSAIDQSDPFPAMLVLERRKTVMQSVLFRAPARLALTLHANRARVQLNRALAHLFQAGQGRPIEPCPGTVRSTHTSQTNRALVVKRTRARFKLASVSTPLTCKINL